MTRKKICKLVVGGIAAVLLVIASVLIKGVYDYLDEVPEVAPIAENMTFSTNTTITAEDLADIQKSTYTKMFVGNMDGALPGLRDNNTVLNTGEFAGTFDVIIDAKGENAEHRDVRIAITVTEETVS